MVMIRSFCLWFVFHPLPEVTILSGQDGPMAGGLATTSTIVRADFWRLGQCRPGDSIRFKRVSWDSARALRERTEAYLAQARALVGQSKSEISLVDVDLPTGWNETILHKIQGETEVIFRQAGDSYIIVTYGPMTANVMTRARIQYRADTVKGYEDIKAVITTTRGMSDPLGTLDIDS
jgi:urea carboxylase